ncbi:MAG TPA: glutamine-hydrolyzing carbamoyl-phosphate synthase small subunit [Nitrospiria bacterium]|nr:glutamine-hydrolyzing carbamoyl-phosphate synthase small subunit [Nitrospiria bacterium]
MKRALLALADGRIFEGRSIGSEGEATGEVVFNTAMAGYQEILTDPSYHGQLVTMTYPLIGNYGVNNDDVEAKRPFVGGFIIKEAARRACNWRAVGTLDHYLARHRIVGIDGIDTRALTRHLRDHGEQPALLSTEDVNAKRLAERARALPGLVGRDLVSEVTCRALYDWHEGLPAGQAGLADRPKGPRPSKSVIVYDFGVKQSILRSLVSVGCRVTVVPASTPAEEVLARQPDGVVLSNGPGDPAALPYAVAAATAILGKRPLFGICLGHQLLGAALGATTYKLKFGHHGANHPVMDLTTGRVEITSQNHGFGVRFLSDVGARAAKGGEVSSEEIPGKLRFPVGDAPTPPAAVVFPSAGLPHDPPQITTPFGRVELTHLSLNDGTVEGLRCLEVPAFSVQYHPEASPGPHDARYLFGRFMEMMGAETN